MIRYDYIMRMIEQMGVVIAAMLGYKKAGDSIKAEEVLENGYLHLLGVSGKFINTLSADDIVHLLNADGADWVKISVAANLLLEDAELCAFVGNTAGAQEKADKAMALMTRFHESAVTDDYDPAFIDMDRFRKNYDQIQPAAPEHSLRD